MDVSPSSEEFTIPVFSDDIKYRLLTKNQYQWPAAKTRSHRRNSKWQSYEIPSNHFCAQGFFSDSSTDSFIDAKPFDPFPASSTFNKRVEQTYWDKRVTMRKGKEHITSVK